MRACLRPPAALVAGARLPFPLPLPCSSAPLLPPPPPPPVSAAAAAAEGGTGMAASAAAALGSRKGMMLSGELDAPRGCTARRSCCSWRPVFRKLPGCGGGCEWARRRGRGGQDAGTHRCIGRVARGVRCVGRWMEAQGGHPVNQLLTQPKVYLWLLHSVILATIAVKLRNTKTKRPPRMETT